jgi:sugar (pentulose or hexulose) kinase
MPWIQYVGFRLCGNAVIEMSSMSSQTHLMNTRTQGFSSLVQRQGWTRLFPRMANAWENIGVLLPEFRGSGFRGRGQVLGGVHDSTANYMRYLCGGFDAFTLVSTGTWSITFDTSTTVDKLLEDRDTNTNTDVLGRTVACSRFFGGREFEIVAKGAPAEAASLDIVAALIRRGTMALPSFTDSGGPVPLSGGKGRMEGAAALYCALMVSEQLDAVSSRHDIIVDGPFSGNPVLLGILSQLRPAQKILASDLRDGTTAGAACLALIDDGQLPHIGLKVVPVTRSAIEGLSVYAAGWKEKAYAHLP